MLESKDFIKVDTLSVATIKWNKSLSDSIVKVRESQLIDWLKTQTKSDSIVIRNN